MAVKAKAAGLKLTVEIEITNTDCVEWGMTDAFCVAPLFPADLAFSRTGAAFDDPNVARRLAGLFNAIAARHGATVITHVFIGNEVDRYMAVVKHDSGVDLVPAYGRMLGAIRARLTTGARPKFGTVVEYQPSAEYAAAPPVACPNVEVLGLTMYPTEEGAEGTDAPPKKIQRWMGAARLAAVGSCALAITEVGASAVSPYGSPADQQALATAVVEWLRANPKTYDFATWFAMSDNPEPTDSVFGGMGLMTRTGVHRPAYATWLAAGKAAL